MTDPSSATKLNCIDDLLLQYKRGDIEAMVNIGRMMEEKGKLAKAAFCYYTAAKAFESEGMFNLGVMYELGEGVRRDLIKAKKWYRAAISVDNHAMASLNLSILNQK